MLGHAVKAVVDHRFAVRQAVIFGQLVVQAAARRTEGHVVHNGRSASAGRRHGAVVKIIHRPGATRLQIHVGMYVHRAGDHILSRRVDHPGFFIRQIPPDTADLLPVNEDVRLIGLRRRHHHAIFDYRFHRLYTLLFRSLPANKFLLSLYSICQRISTA